MIDSESCKKLAKSCKNMQKSCNDFYCENCDYVTCRKSSYIKHIESKKHKVAESSKKLQKSCNDFYCEFCDYVTYRKSSYVKHFESKKHKVAESSKKLQVNEVTYNNKNNENIQIDKEVIMNLMKENIDFKNIMIEQQKQHTLLLETIKEQKLGVTNITNNNNNNTNSNNKITNTFNLNLFLNETCKDAMNIKDFVDSIKLQLQDLINVGNIGYVNGISNIIVRELKDLDITKRPIHCTDEKRNILYIKDENKWEKDDRENNKMKKSIRVIANKNIPLLKEYKTTYQDINDLNHSKKTDKYDKLVLEVMGGSGDDELYKEEKIIKSILKNITINKNDVSK
jgi:hypothetical protein